MTTTLVDRGTLWEQRRAAVRELSAMRVFRHALCGCRQCGDQARIDKLNARIQATAMVVDDLTNRMCERKA